MHKRLLSSCSILTLPLCTFLCAFHVSAVRAETATARDATAVSRAARDADNPLRVIIEASKLKGRIKPDGDSAEAPPSEKSEKRVVRPAAKPAAAAAAVKAAAPASQAASAPPHPTLASAADAMPTALSAPAPILPTPKALPAVLLPLKLMQLVEPSLPDSVMRRLRNDIEVVVGFTVNADGSVSNVAIRSTPMKALDAAIVEAVSQWRYQPIAEERTHAVQLVLRANH